MNKPSYQFKKWYPKCGERFYYISQSGTVSSTRAGKGRDTYFKIATGNFFKTYEQAHRKLKDILIDLKIPFFPWGKVECPARADIHPDMPEHYILK